jgi:hypothetical protein
MLSGGDLETCRELLLGWDEAPARLDQAQVRRFRKQAA